MFAINELLALDARGMLAGVFATKPGDAGPHQPGIDRLAARVEVLPEGSPVEQGEALAARLAQRPITGIHAYFAHTPAEVAEHAASRLSIPFGFSVHARDARKVDDVTLSGRARRAVCVVACNVEVAKDLARAGARAHLVPHGVDLLRFTVAPTPDAPPFHVLAVGRFVEKKGFDVLIDAMALLEETFTLRIVGDGPERSRLAARIAAQGLQRRVVLVDACTHTHLPAEYANAHVVAAPSVVDASGDRDGLPTVVLEAMASGRPVIGTRVGAIESAVRHGDTGLLVPPRAPRPLADAIRVVATDSGWRTTMGLLARRVVERKYDLSTCSAAFADLLAGAYA
jgi:glycosyltransferase involved in cell wall biosynthesis